MSSYQSQTICHRDALLRRQLFDGPRYRFFVQQLVPQESANELEILCAACGELGNCKVLRRRTDRGNSMGVPVLYCDRSLHPERRKYRGFRTYPVRVVAELLVERRFLSNRTVYNVRLSRIVKGIEIRFHGNEQFLRGLGERRQDCLAADDDNRVASGQWSLTL